MVIFKTFVIFLIIFIYEIIIEARRIYPTYSVGITGELRCRYKNTKNAFVEISNDPRPIIERNPIAMKVTKFKEAFFLAAFIRSFRRPYLYAKVIHSCLKFERPFIIRVLVKNIPLRFLKKSKHIYYFNLGVIELSNYPGTNIDLWSLKHSSSKRRA